MGYVSSQFAVEFGRRSTTLLPLAKTMPNWTRAARVDECPPGSAKEVVLGERIVALFHVEGEVFALDGICSHQGGPLGEGELNGCMVTCPWHGWQYDVRSGRHGINSSVSQQRFDARVEGDWIEVDLS